MNADRETPSPPHSQGEDALPAEDALLLSQIRAGDADAGHRFIREHYPSIHRYLLYLTGQREIAEDLTQETFFQAWRHLDRFEGRAPLRHWLHRIAHREFLRSLRGRRALVSLEEVGDLPAPRVEAWTDAVELRELLRKLPLELRVVTVLHYLEGYPCEEIARIVRAPEGTIKYRLSTARARLHGELGEGDLAYLNEPLAPTRRWAWLPLEEMSVLEARLAMGAAGRETKEDTMERREFLRQAAAGAAGLMLSEKEVIDSRLTRKVTLAIKATALSDLCEHLRVETGVHLAAGPSVADEKMTIFCEKQPLRDVMRQLSRPFGYTWLRSGTPGQYRYELVQDLRSQLLEEELRNRDRNAALLALEKEIERYRPYLDLSPDEAMARTRTAAPSEKALLEKLAGYGWGPIQMYRRLSRTELAALHAGGELKYASEPLYGERTLPPQIGQGVLQSMRDRRVRLDRGLPGREEMYSVTDAGDPRGIPLTAAAGVVATVSLSLHQSELGQFTLRGVSGFYANGRPGRRPADTHAWGDANPLAVGRNPAAPPQGAMDRRLMGDPSLRARVTIQPQPSPAPGSEGEPGGLRTPPGPASGPGSLPSHPKEGATREAPPEPKVTSADVLEALHQASGLPIAADYYTCLYKPEAVSVRDRLTFEALDLLCDAMGMRCNKEAGGGTAARSGAGPRGEAAAWLQFRSSNFYTDRIKEVPNRLLTRWAASRRRHGALTLEDLAEIAQLPDAQLDGAKMAEGARELWGLVEWDLVRNESLRPHLRFLAGFTPAQRQEAMSPSGLAFARMPLAQQQAFIARALIPEAGPLQSLEEMEGAVLRVDYTQPGWFEWRPPGAVGNLQWVLPVAPGRRAPRAPVRERTREAVLQSARRLYSQLQETLLRVERKLNPQVDPSELSPRESQIVPTRLNLTVLYVPGAAHSRLITWTSTEGRNWTTTWE
jgi:RNA polymerase sigma-70 factor (ECF subfamily)